MPDQPADNDSFVVDPDAESNPEPQPSDAPLPETTEADVPNPENPAHAPTDPNASEAGAPDEVAERNEDALEAVGGDDRPRLETDDSAPPGSPLDEQEPNQTTDAFEAEQEGAPDQTPPEPDAPAEPVNVDTAANPETEHERQSREIDEIAQRTGQDSSLNVTDETDTKPGTTAAGQYA
jgi:hypothetical protein